MNDERVTEEEVRSFLGVYLRRGGWSGSPFEGGWRSIYIMASLVAGAEGYGVTEQEAGKLAGWIRTWQDEGQGGMATADTVDLVDMVVRRMPAEAVVDRYGEDYQRRRAGAVVEMVSRFSGLRQE